MNGIIKIIQHEGKEAVSAKHLYSVLGMAQQHWAKWVAKNITGNEFAVEGEDFIELPLSGRTPDFVLSTDFTKRIGMLSRTEKGEAVRNFFIDREKELQQIKSNQVPQTYAQALLEAGRLALEVETQKATIAELAPKADFFDQVVGSKDCFDMADVAKVCNLGVGRNTLFQFLREHKILRENNTPYQQYIDSAYFRVIESKYNKPDGSVYISLKTVVYQKGIDFIIKRWTGRNLKVA